MATIIETVNQILAKKIWVKVLSFSVNKYTLFKYNSWIYFILFVVVIVGTRSHSIIAIVILSPYFLPPRPLVAVAQMAVYQRELHEVIRLMSRSASLTAQNGIEIWQTLLYRAVLWSVYEGPPAFRKPNWRCPLPLVSFILFILRGNMFDGNSYRTYCICKANMRFRTDKKMIKFIHSYKEQKNVEGHKRQFLKQTIHGRKDKFLESWYLVDRRYITCTKHGAVIFVRDDILFYYKTFDRM